MTLRTNLLRRIAKGTQITAILLLASVAMTAQQVETRVSPAVMSTSVPEQKVTAANTSRLQIGPGDLLEMSVFDVPEMTQPVRVTDTGDATISLIGTVHLAGLSAVQAQELIADKLRDGKFILNPRVTIAIREYSTQGVSLLGEVKKPGVYQVLGSRTLLDILSEAGGMTPVAGTQISIKHRNGTRDLVTATIDNDAQASLANDIELFPGDTVIVPRAGLVYVVGDVGRPGGFIMQNNGKLTVLQAVAMAEGANRTASLNGAKIIRKVDGKYTESPIELKKILQGKSQDVDLTAEDIVFVPSSASKTFMAHGLQGILQSASTAAIYTATR